MFLLDWQIVGLKNKQYLYFRWLGVIFDIIPYNLAFLSCHKIGLNKYITDSCCFLIWLEILYRKSFNKTEKFVKLSSIFVYKLQIKMCIPPTLLCLPNTKIKLDHLTHQVYAYCQCEQLWVILVLIGLSVGYYIYTINFWFNNISCKQLTKLWSLHH